MMDEAYIRERVVRVFAQAEGGKMIDRFTALIIELLDEQATQTKNHANDSASVAEPRAVP